MFSFSAPSNVPVLLNWVLFAAAHSGFIPLMSKLPAFLLHILAPKAYRQYRELLLLSYDLLSILGLAHTTMTLGAAFVQQLSLPRHIIFISILRQLFMPLRPLAAAVRWGLLCPFMVSHVLCTLSDVCPSSGWASARLVAEAVAFNGLLLLGSLVLSVVTDMAARRAFVRSLSSCASQP